MTNSKQTTQQPESPKAIPELSLEQLRQVSGGQTIFVDTIRILPAPTGITMAE
ncbi:MAG: hypothetical protein KGN16_13445 [Burkholderiales bacterium]|nr:hypothetical protein [Burkholderiales bacterium]